MGTLSEELILLADTLGIAVDRLPQGEEAALRAALRERFAWRNIDSLIGESLHDRNAWRRIGDLCEKRAVVLLFDRRCDGEALVVPSGATLSTLIGESEGFVFYVSDRRGRFLLAFRDDDVLVACGSAARRLARLRDAEGPRARVKLPLRRAPGH